MSALWTYDTPSIGCSKDDPKEPIIRVESVSLNKTTLALVEGNSETLTATVSPSAAMNKKVTWKSGSPTIATVADGKVTAVKAGTTTIIVTTEDGGKTATCEVTVTDQTVAVTDVKLNKTTTELAVGATETLTATITPADATNQKVTWKSGNTAIATVTDGEVTAIKAGTTTIIVTTEDGGKTVTCEVAVVAKDLINIPDANFKKYLVANYDTDKDGEISLPEAEKVTKISCYDKGIKSLEGIQFFTNLESLVCAANDLTSLNLSKNTNLTELNCYGNALTSLNLSQNIKLTELECHGNILTYLNVSQNIKLTNLNCVNNNLTSLDVSKNTNLKELECHQNKLTSLDLSKQNVLGHLYCGNQKENKTLQLTLLPTYKAQWNNTWGQHSANANVKVTWFGEAPPLSIPDANFKKYLVANFDTDKDGEISLSEAEIVTIIKCTERGIKSLEGIQYFTNLWELECEKNNLTSLDISKNTDLTNLSCYQNKLTSLDVTKNTKLEAIHCGENNLTSLNLSNQEKLEFLYCGNQSRTLQLTLLSKYKTTWDNSWGKHSDNANVTVTWVGNVQIPDVNFKKYLVDKFDRNKDGEISFSEAEEIMNINCSSKGIKSLEGIQHFTNLGSLICSENNLSSLDVSKNINIWELLCDQNSLTSLDVSKNTKLMRLHCYQNRFTSLDVSNNIKLQHLYCYANDLTYLVLSKNTKLEYLHCSENKLSSLNLSNQDKLVVLYCGTQKASRTLQLTLLSKYETIWKNTWGKLYQNVNVTVTWK